MNIERLLEIALEADKIGDYVTADRVTNLLKTAQGQNSAYPNQASQVNPNTNNSTKILSDQEYNNIKTQYISNIISNTHAWNTAYVRHKAHPNQQDLATMHMITDKNANTFEAIKQDNRLTQEQKNMLKAEGTEHMNSINSKYESGQLQQTPQLQVIGGPGTAPVPIKDEQGQYPGMSAMPQMNQQMPQQGGVYNPGMAPGATYYTPGIVNVTQPQPQMTDEQKAFADFRALKAKIQQANQSIRQQYMQPEQYPMYLEYPTYRRPVYQGTNTQAQYNFNPNAPINPQLYGSGYASMAMAPQQLMPQQPQTQQTYQNLNNYSYNQNYNTPANQNYYNNAMMQQQQQQNFPLANHSGDFYFESDNGGPIDQSMNVAFGTQNNSAKYRDGNPNMSPTR